MKESERRLIERLIGTLERVKLDEYVEYVSNRKRLVLTNLFCGMLRGLGFSLGFTVLGAAAVVLVQHLLSKNIPQIGEYLAEVIDAIENRR